MVPLPRGKNDEWNLGGLSIPQLIVNIPLFGAARTRHSTHKNTSQWRPAVLPRGREQVLRSYYVYREFLPVASASLVCAYTFRLNIAASSRVGANQPLTWLAALAARVLSVISFSSVQGWSASAPSSFQPLKHLSVESCRCGSVEGRRTL